MRAPPESAPRRRAGAPAVRGARDASRIAPWLAAACRAAPFAAALALLVSIRHSLPGVAVADDYAFLDRARFQHPLDPFDSMGAAYYWRPVARQVWFSLLAPWLLRAPWAAAALAAFLLAALAFLLHRIVRRASPDRPWLAPLVAAAPLLSESSRALLIWPSGAQHLLAAVGVAAAIHEAARGRRASAALAALVAVLSHELAVLALPILPWVAPRAAGGRRPWVALAAAVAGVWLAGELIARNHGVRLPPASATVALAHVPTTLAQVFMAAAGAEEARPLAFLPILAAALALSVVALVWLARRRGRDAAGLVLIAALVAALPLAALGPDWDAWRAFIPVVALASGLTLALARGGPGWAAGLVALRLVALVSAEPAESATLASPRTASELSFRRLARMQHLVDGTRRVIAPEAGRLPQGARVRYWDLPRAAVVGFESDLAVRVWLRDSTATFAPFGGEAGFQRLPDRLIAYPARTAQPPVVVTPRALETYRLALAAAGAQQRARADSLYAAALLAQSPEAAPMTVAALRARALIALVDRRVADARRFADASAALDGPTPGSLALDGCVALSEGRPAEAEQRLREALRRDPGNAIATQGLANLEWLNRRATAR